METRCQVWMNPACLTTFPHLNLSKLYLEILNKKKKKGGGKPSIFALFIIDTYQLPANSPSVSRFYPKFLTRVGWKPWCPTSAVL